MWEFLDRFNPAIYFILKCPCSHAFLNARIRRKGSRSYRLIKSNRSYSALSNFHADYLLSVSFMDIESQSVQQLISQRPLICIHIRQHHNLSGKRFSTSSWDNSCGRCEWSRPDWCRVCPPPSTLSPLFLASGVDFGSKSKHYLQWNNRHTYKI
jgi:hypothetical protein